MQIQMESRPLNLLYAALLRQSTHAILNCLECVLDLHFTFSAPEFCQTLGDPSSPTPAGLEPHLDGTAHTNGMLHLRSRHC